MEFTTVEQYHRQTTKQNAKAGTSTQIHAPITASSSSTTKTPAGTNGSKKSALQDDDSELSDSILRSRYNEAIQAHLHTPVKAVGLYDALLNDARLQRAPLAALSESIHDPFDSGVASIRMRMKLRGLILKNRAKLEEELADEQHKKTNSSPQQASTSSSSFSSTPSSSSSPSYSSSLQLYLDAIDAIESSQLLESRLLTMQRAEGITTSHSTADTRLHQPSHSQSPATLTELYDSNLLVDDCEIWLRTARVAWLNKKYSIARQALETAFKLSPDNFNVLEQLIDLLYILSDYFLLLPLLTHTLRLDPYHAKSLILQRQLWQLNLPTPGMIESEDYYRTNYILEHEIDPNQIQSIQTRLSTLKGDYDREGATIHPVPIPHSNSPVDLTNV